VIRLVSFQFNKLSSQDSREIYFFQRLSLLRKINLHVRARTSVRTLANYGRGGGRNKVATLCSWKPSFFGHFCTVEMLFLQLCDCFSVIKRLSENIGSDRGVAHVN
jgi:hypothetical protein